VINGDKVGLRARLDTDVPILHAELYNDVATTLRADSRPWRPIPPGSKSPYAVPELSDNFAAFSVVELVNGELVGEAVLWGLDIHNRFAHLGIAMLPAHRGRGLGADTIRALCYYGFFVRGLHRLQLETLSDNDAMRATAQRCGFRLEGTTRQSAWVGSGFADDVIFGLLASEWRAAQPTSEGTEAGSQAGTDG
jgi:RimJ/RimL family protein N-acetyltransferase